MRCFLIVVERKQFSATRILSKLPDSRRRGEILWVPHTLLLCFQQTIDFGG